VDIHEHSEAINILAEGILKFRFAGKAGSVNPETGEEYIREFLNRGMSDAELGKLSERNLVRLFEKYCEFEQMKKNICRNQR